MTEKEIEEIIYNACEHSLYAYNDSISKGYISKGGVRIGLCGKCVFEKGKVLTISDFSSLCIRFPHEVDGCSTLIYEKIKQRDCYNILLISPPGQGKTTVLRDLTKLISKSEKNILVIDEKEEIAPNEFDVGDTTDVLSGCDKRFGLYSAIKHLCPDVVVVDELTNKSDVEGVVFARRSGVSVIASVHGSSVADVQEKKYMKKALSKDIFDFMFVIRLINGEISIIEEKTGLLYD